MPLQETKQALSIINRASNIALIVPPKPTTDAFASMVALYLALLKNHKGTIDAISTSHVPTNTQFLPGSSQVQTKPRIQPDVILDIAGPNTIADTRQEQLDGGIRLHITFTEQDHIAKENLEVHVRQLPYDAVIILGAADLGELGDLFTNNTDFFYSTPIINIDYRAGNEHFGTVNIVDITYSSIAEVTYELITTLEKANIEHDIATALYAGIVAATNSFQNPATTPHALQLAAELITKHADREAVIQHLVKTKPLHLLQLTGRTYARLRHDEYGKLFWSILRPLDFHESKAKQEHIPDVIRELTNNVSGYNACFLLYENSAQQYHAYIKLGKGLIKRRQEIQKQLEAQKENGALILNITATSLKDAEEHALEKIRSILPQT